MAAQGEDEGIAVTNGNEQEVEMTSLESAEERLKVIAHSNNVQEPSVVFVVKDTTTTDWHKSRYTYSLPLSTAVTDLYSAIAKEAGMCVSDHVLDVMTPLPNRLQGRLIFASVV